MKIVSIMHLSTDWKHTTSTHKKGCDNTYGVVTREHWIDTSLLDDDVAPLYPSHRWRVHHVKVHAGEPSWLLKDIFAFIAFSIDWHLEIKWVQLRRFFICQASSFWRGLVRICNWKERQRVREVFWLKKVLTGFKSHKTYPLRQINMPAAAPTWICKALRSFYTNNVWFVSLVVKQQLRRLICKALTICSSRLSWFVKPWGHFMLTRYDL